MADDIELTIDDATLIETLSRYVEPWLASIVDSIATLAMQTAPVGQDDPLGRPRKFPLRLRDTLTSWVEGENTIELVGYAAAEAPYAVFVHEGTSGPYDIPSGGATEQKSKGYPLRFYFPKAGAVVRPWTVSHPGIRTPQPFLRDAMIQVVTASEGSVIA